MKILGIGNAIVDVICKVENNFLENNGLTKSTMKLVDEIEFKKLSNEAAKYREKKQKDINDANLKRINATAKLLSLINPILAKYSEEKNISIILSKKNIIMGKNELDITDDIMVLVDKQIKEFKIK